MTHSLPRQLSPTAFCGAGPTPRRRSRRTERRRGAGVALGVVVISLLGACSGGEGDSEGDSSPAPAAATAEGVDGLVFSEVAEQAGLTGSASDLDLYGEAAMTSGAAVADVDGDGDQDIFLPRVGKPNALYLNDGDGNFTDDARRAGLAGAAQRFGSAAAAFFDIDGDGDMDLFVAGSGQGENELFVNDGTGDFEEQSAERGLSWPTVTDTELGAQHHGVSVADVDNDGDMDLLVLQWFSEIYNGEAIQRAADEGVLDETAEQGPCRSAAALAELGFPVPDGSEQVRSALFHNDGTGTFADVTEQYGLPLDEIVAFTGSFGDLDGDGWQDLAITGDGCTSRLFRNVDGQRFEDITDSAGVGTDENGMGSVLADVNGDGLADWFVTSIAHPDDEGCRGGGFFGCSGNRLFVNQGDLTFADETDAYGLRDGGWGWGAAIQDFSNDGRVEVTATNGYRVEADPAEEGGSEESGSDFLSPFLEDSTRFWVLDGEQYVDVAEAVGIDDTTIAHALVPFDMDGDGDLDLLIVPRDDSPLLYRNDTDERNWLTVSLDDPTAPGNRWGDGARIEVTVTDGDEPIVGWITTTGSYESQKPPQVHVGLGDRSEPVDRVEVYWPGDAEPQVLIDVEPNQQLVVERAT